MASWTNPIDYPVSQTTCVQRFDESILDNINFAGSHTHTGATGQGANIAGSSLVGSSPNQSVYEFLSIIPLPVFAASETSGNIWQIGAGLIGLGYYQIKNIKGASVKFLTDIHSGTWNAQLFFRASPCQGITSVCINGASVGQVDTWRTTGSQGNNLSAASTFSLSSSGQFVLKLEQTASNVGSNGYAGQIQFIQLTRVSA